LIGPSKPAFVIRTTVRNGLFTQTAAFASYPAGVEA
jgi:hypothetical protein